MNILLAFLLYRNFSTKELKRISPFLPNQTRRGINAMLAYDSTCDIECDSDDAQDENSFPFLLFRLIGMQQPSQAELFSLLKSMLPKEMAANLPDPETLMSMMSILSAMDFSSDTASECDDKSECDDESESFCNGNDANAANQDNGFSKDQRDFFESFIRK